MPNDDYDTPWKDALTRYFPEFMAFYFPRAHAEIDWARPHSFLDQELAQLAEGEGGKRVADKLIKLCLRGGAEQWVLVHVEVQSQRTRDFAERVFTCNYRVYDRYRAPVASLAVLADSSRAWRPRSFGYALFGCRMRLWFPVVKLLDFAPRVASLLRHDNPFALLTAVHLMTQRSQHDMALRMEQKRQIARLLYRRDWHKRRIIELFNVVDWLMRLPEELERQLWRELRESEQGGIMPHMLSIERIIRADSRKLGLEEGRQQGMQEGRQQGMQQGMQEGRREGQVQLLAMQMRHRFGALPPAAEQQLAAASMSQLDQWALALLQAETLEQVFRAH
jgi:hypothetical protein